MEDQKSQADGIPLSLLGLRPVNCMRVFTSSCAADNCAVFSWRSTFIRWSESRASYSARRKMSIGSDGFWMCNDPFRTQVNRKVRFSQRPGSWFAGGNQTGVCACVRVSVFHVHVNVEI